jgi:hypothetical protein
LKNSVEAYVGCVAGALLKEDYLRAAREAGFAGVDVLDERTYDVEIESVSADLREEALASVVSIKVRGTKPTR